MRILIVSDAWYPQVNGVVRALDTTAQFARDRGHEVDVLGPNRFRTLPLPTYPDIRIAVTRRGRIGRIIEALAPDAVHVATEGPLGWFARSWLRRRGIPFTTSFHTLFPHYVRLRTGLPEAVTFALLRRFHGAAQATMVSTPTLQALLAGHGFSRLVRWVRGVDTDMFRPLAGGVLAGSSPKLLYVGRVALEKNLEAFLAQDLPGSKFVVGTGPQLAELSTRYPSVSFLGELHGDDLVRAYSAADAFVFPSRTDTLGLVMLEAMACGVPVAAYPVQGPLDVVADSGAGVLDEDLGTAVRRAIGIEPETCRRRALEFSWHKSVDQFIANLAPIRLTAAPVEAI